MSAKGCELRIAFTCFLFEPRSFCAPVADCQTRLASGIHLSYYRAVQLDLSSNFWSPDVSGPRRRAKLTWRHGYLDCQRPSDSRGERPVMDFAVSCVMLPGANDSNVTDGHAACVRNR
jgi:hypothetical protein